jgi:hypothetical protein
MPANVCVKIGCLNFLIANPGVHVQNAPIHDYTHITRHAVHRHATSRRPSHKLQHRAKAACFGFLFNGVHESSMNSPEFHHVLYKTTPNEGEKTNG